MVEYTISLDGLSQSTIETSFSRWVECQKGGVVPFCDDVRGIVGGDATMFWRPPRMMLYRMGGGKSEKVEETRIRGSPRISNRDAMADINE